MTFYRIALQAEQVHEQDMALIPGGVFLLVEIGGSGGVSDQLEQIARILHEQGYWKRYCQLNAMMSLFFSESGEEMLFFQAHSSHPLMKLSKKVRSW